MDATQITQQLVWALAPARFTWGVGLNEAVLSRVVAGPAPLDFFQHDLVTPAALLHVDAGTDHEEHPADLVEKQTWTLELYAANATEQSGSAAVVGGNRADLGSSRGRGLLEIEPLVKAAIFNAIGLTARSVGGASVAVAGKMGGLIAVRALEITATRFPSLPDYAPVRQLKGSAGALAKAFFTILNNPLVGVWSFVANLSVGSVVVVAGADFAIGVNAAATAVNLAAALNTKLAGIGAASTFAAAGPNATLTLAGGETLTSLVANQNTGGAFAASATPPQATVTLTFAAAPSRYDLVGFSWARGTNGGAYPTDPTIATFVANPAATSLTDLAPSGTWPYTLWFAFDSTVDPYTGTGVVPVAPNAWSGYATAQAGRVYVAANVSVVIP